MAKYRKLSHVVYRCEYHIVFVPKYRFRVLTGAIGELVERDIRVLCGWREVECWSCRCKRTMCTWCVRFRRSCRFRRSWGLLKGELAIKLFKSYPRLKRKPYWGNHFWARGYFVSTVGADEQLIRR